MTNVELVLPVAVYGLNAGQIPLDLVGQISAIWAQAGIRVINADSDHISTQDWPMVYTPETLKTSMQKLAPAVWDKATVTHGPFPVCIIFCSWFGRPNGLSCFNSDIHVSFIRDQQEIGRRPLRRVSSHEFGHRLLGGEEDHLDDPDNLMSEGHLGTTLTDSQISIARSWASVWLAANP